MAAKEHSLKRRRPAYYTHQRNVRKGHPAGVMPAWADEGTMDGLYREARRLTLETGVAHHVDHIVPLRGRLPGGAKQIVSGLHVENNLRIVVASDNMSRWCWFNPEVDSSDAVGT